MIVILEGPDCCGKTTLAKKLMQKTAGVYFHSDNVPELIPAMKQYHESILRNAQVNNELGSGVFLDRHWPSQWVYGQLFRPQLHDPGMFNYWLKYYGNVRYLFCHRDDSIEAHAKERHGSHPYTDAEYIKIVAKYAEWVAMMPKNLVITHHFEGDIDSTLQNLRNSYARQ